MATRQLEITILSGVSAGDLFRFDLEEGGSVTLGRAEDCDIVLQDPMVSRRHAKVFRTENGFSLADLNSTHGTTHMGFTLTAGDADARRLTSSDEFKIGQSLFRVGFESGEAAEPTGVDRSSSSVPIKRWQKKEILRWGAVAAGLGILGFLLLPEKAPELPPQQSHQLLNMPQLRVLGNLKAGKAQTQSDHSHLDKVQLRLPSADVVTEFEYLAEAPVQLILDSHTIQTLEPSVGSWRREAYVFRDPQAGIERVLVFDNTDFPKPTGKGGPVKKWAVRDVRSTPIDFDSRIDLLTALRQTRTAAEKLGQTADSSFNLLRALQRTMMTVLYDSRMDYAKYSISPEAIPPESTRYVQKLDDLIRRQELGTLPSQTLLETLQSLAADLDAELWRRTEIGLHRAEQSAKQKAFVTAHDSLAGIMALFREGEDRRWDLAQELMQNKKVVPTKIRENPDKFRKREEKKRK